MIELAKESTCRLKLKSLIRLLNNLAIIRYNILRSRTEMVNVLNRKI